MYHQGSNNLNQGTSNHKALNGGCIAGRAGQMRHLFAFEYDLRYVFRDDQHLAVLYLQQNPDMVTLDTESSIFLTTFKMSSLFEANGWTIGKDLTFNIAPQKLANVKTSDRTSSSIGFIHCNSKASSNVYATLSEQLRDLHNRYYSGPDGPLLIGAVNAIN